MTVTLDTDINELVRWLQLEYPELVQDMHDSTHHYDNTKPNSYHLEGDVWTHTMMVCLQAQNLFPDNNLVKWSSMLHDIGKPGARFVNEETQRVSFIGHEGLSTFMAIDILNAADIPVADKLMICKLIALHGDLFRFVDGDNGTVKPEVADMFLGEKTLLQNLVAQVVADSTGRFYNAGRVSDIEFIRDLPMYFEPVLNEMSDEVSGPVAGAPTVTVLVGPPGCGKSTWVEANAGDTEIISRDALVELAGSKRGMNYSETFKFLVENKDISKEEVDGVLTQNVAFCRKQQEDVIIDMTNMSKKGRRRWINEFSKFNKKAVVFMTGLETVKTRNKIRAVETGKSIPESVLVDMCKRFTLPLYSEGFDEIEFIWSE